MATTSWFINSGGSDRNSGSSSGTTAKVSGTASGVVAGTTFTDLGATFITAGVVATDAVNIQVAGVDSIYEIASVDSETQLTLAAAPANATYDYKIGGARATPSKVCLTSAGNNIALSTGDTIFIAPATYTSRIEGNSTGVRLMSSTPGTRAVIDGTGGGAGSDCISGNGPPSCTDIECQNAVDMGFGQSGNSGYYNVACVSHNCGNHGFFQSSGGGGQNSIRFCASYSNGGDGFSLATNGQCWWSNLRSSENTGDGIELGSDTIAMPRNIDQILSYDNGGDGMRCAIATNMTPLATTTISHCTFEGNSVDGLEFTGAFNFYGEILNCLFTNNGAYGMRFAQDPGFRLYNRNNGYFGNTTAARLNFSAGLNEVTTDPQYTAAASDDYTIKSTGSAFRAGFAPYPSPNLVSMGAVPGPGSAEVISSGVSGGGGGVMPSPWRTH